MVLIIINKYCFILELHDSPTLFPKTDEVRLKNAAIMDLKKALGEETLNNKKLSASLDATRSERNMLHKNYTEALDEIQDLKHKMKVNS